MMPRDVSAMSEPAQVLLRFEGLSVVRNGRTILTIPDTEPTATEITGGGRITALVGPNGAGKTTLLRVLQGLLSPSTGRLVCPGSVPPKRAILLQNPVLLRRTARANIEFVLKRQKQRADVQGKPARRQVAEEYLARAGLLDSADRPARHLSGGQQRRLAFAQALAQEPEILLLDEPTAGLDPAASASVEQMIATSAAGGISIFLSSHELGQVRRLADRVLFLNAGTLVESGALPALFDAPRSEELTKFLKGDLIC